MAFGNVHAMQSAPSTFGLVALTFLIAVGCSDDDRFDFVSRCFGPRVGINEDPVTGSAHCALATYWAGRLGRTEFLNAVTGNDESSSLFDDVVNYRLKY